MPTHNADILPWHMQEPPAPSPDERWAWDKELGHIRFYISVVPIRRISNGWYSLDGGLCCTTISAVKAALARMREATHAALIRGTPYSIRFLSYRNGHWVRWELNTQAQFDAASSVKTPEAME